MGCSYPITQINDSPVNDVNVSIFLSLSSLSLFPPISNSANLKEKGGQENENSHCYYILLSTVKNNVIKSNSVQLVDRANMHNKQIRLVSVMN